MPRCIAITASPIAVAIALAAAPARAVDCTGVVSPCINDDVLWPHAGPALFVGVGSARTVLAGQMGFGLVTSYLSRPVVLLVAPPPAGTRESAVDDQVNGTFLWAYGVTDRLELDVALPLTFGQSGTGLAPVTAGAGLRDTAVRDMRFGFAYAIASGLRAAARGEDASALAAPDGWRLAGRFEVSAPTGDEDQFAGERSVVFAPSVSGEVRREALFAGAEVGARLRPTTELLGVDVGSQIVSSVGVGYDLLPRALLSAQLEAWALPPFAGQSTIVPAEWQLSARSAPARGGALSIQIGGGGGIPFAGDLPITTPRFRFTLGVRWDGGLDARAPSK